MSEVILDYLSGCLSMSLYSKMVSLKKVKIISNPVFKWNTLASHYSTKMSFSGAAEKLDAIKAPKIQFHQHFSLSFEGSKCYFSASRLTAIL